MPDVLAADGLRVRYPEARAPVVRDLDLRLGAGERLLLLGPSGSGKSSVLRAATGVLGQTIDADVGGRLTVCGQDPRETPVAQLAAHVATLTQDPADQLCLPRVWDEVAFALENRAVDPAQIPARVAAALERVGAGHLAERRTSELSGGEGQRVALAAALVAEPELLLLDEPTALLDVAGAAQVGALLARAGSGQVLIEHRLDDLGDLPPRTLVLGPDGAVVADGPTEEVLHLDAVAATGTWLPARIEAARALGRPVAPGGLPDALRELAGPAGASDAVRRRGGQRLLSARAATVRRGPAVVLEDVDLTVRAGTITAVLGANGSGKSSLLLALAGLLPSGGIESSARVGMVFQNPEHQFVARTVVDELHHGMPAGGDIAPALADYHLTGLEDRDPFRLSGGQQRRLSLAAMAVMEDDVLLADEPTFGQDRVTTGEVADRLCRWADTGGAVVLVTHDLRLVAEIADHVLLLAGGRVLASGTVDEVLEAGLLARAGLRLPPLLAAWDGPMTAMRPALRTLGEAGTPAAVAPWPTRELS